MATAVTPRGERPPWVASDLYPFADHWADIDGNLVHYVDEGTGTPLLLLHSNPSWSFGWRDVIARLSGQFRCIAPDYPGFGLSEAAPGYDFRARSHSRVIERLLDRLEIDEVTVFGYAWGGPIGLGLAGRRPERVRAIVIGSTWGWPLTALGPRLFSALMGGPLSPLLVGRLNLMLRLYLPMNLKRAQLTVRERAAYDGPFPPRKRGIMAVLPREIVGGRSYLEEVAASLPRLADKPCLILWPDSDPGLGEADLARWQQTFPLSLLTRIRHCGPFMDEDAPEDVAAAVLAWWSDQDDPGAR